ncbi:MAG TPA: efflux RND transporter periplasmic adaptor subunit [Caulobacteraceae bacterium]|nr:efflux RND transporter periplasmic adaptor subunit [Caulobacteraceae bacterium]
MRKVEYKSAWAAGLAGGLAMAAALLTAACGEQTTPAASTAPRYAERLILQEQTIPDLKPVTATITSRDQAEARARLGGLLAVMSVRAGDVVRRGQLIGRVIDPQVGFQTQAYGAQIAAAQAQAEQAQAELGRTRDLFDKGVYAKARLDQQVAAARSAEGALHAARAQRAASAALGGEGAILAPADGQVLRADVPAGSVVTPGQSVATVTSGPMVIRVEVPEADAHALSVGASVPVSAPQLRLAGASAVVTQIYPAVAGGQVTVDLTAPGLGQTMVGQRAVISLTIGRRNALVLPRRFIATRDGVDYARVLGADGAAIDVPVQLAPGPTADTAEALSGVAPGDVLVRGGAGQ